MSIKAVWGGVIFKEAMSFLPDYFDSIEKQTDQDFDIFFINDNMSEEEINEAFSGHEELRKKAYISDKFYGLGLKPYELRVKLIDEIYTKYEKDSCPADTANHTVLIIGDCDDKFSDNRVKLTKDAYDGKTSLYYNELLKWNKEPAMPPLPEKVEDMDALLEGNFIGMSTMAVDVSLMNEEFIKSLNEGRTFAFDWYLSSRIIAEIAPAKLVPEAYTYYRIHESNQAGLIRRNEEAVKKEIEVKIRHYELMYDTINCVCAPIDLRGKYKQLKEIYELLDSREVCERFCSGDTEYNSNLMFWWDIIHIFKEEKDV